MLFLNHSNVVAMLENIMFVLHLIEVLYCR